MERQTSPKESESEVKGERAADSSDSYIALLMLSIAELMVYIDNLKSFPQLPNLRESFRGCAYNKGVPVLLALSILLVPLLCFPSLSGLVCESAYGAYKPSILVPLL